MIGRCVGRKLGKNVLGLVPQSLPFNSALQCRPGSTRMLLAALQTLASNTMLPKPWRSSVRTPALGLTCVQPFPLAPAWGDKVRLLTACVGGKGNSGGCMEGLQLPLCSPSQALSPFYLRTTLPMTSDRLLHLWSEKHLHVGEGSLGGAEGLPAGRGTGL